MAGAALIGLAAGAAAVTLATQGSAPSGPLDRASIEAIVHDYLLAHPEVLSEAAQRLSDNRTAKSIADNRPALEAPFASAWAGNPHGDVTLVEFTDYACGFCRASVKDVDRLIAEDKGLRVVYREIAVISDESQPAAEAALAAAQVGRHAAFHHALFAAGALSEDTLGAVKRQTGVTDAKPSDSVEHQLAENVALARDINLGGTPTFVVGNQILSGAIGYDALKQAIASARALRHG